VQTQAFTAEMSLGGWLDIQTDYLWKMTVIIWQFSGW